MANTRTLLVRSLVTNGVTVKGIATLSFTPEFILVANTDVDGIYGVDSVNRSVLKCGVTMTCADITAAIGILNGTLGDTTFEAMQSGASGASIWQQYELDVAADGAIVWYGMNINVPKEGDASVTLTGEVRFVDGTRVFSDLFAITVDQAATAAVYASRYYRAHNFSFDPTGAPTAIALTHVDNLSLALTAPILTDYGDDDVCITAVDRLPFAPLIVTLDHKSTLVTASQSVNAELMEAIDGILTVDLLGRGGVADVVVTVNNVQWVSAPHNESQGFTTYQLVGQASWRDAAANYALVDITGPPAFTGLFTIA